MNTIKHPYLGNSRIDRSKYSRIEVYLPHSVYDRIKSIFPEKSGIVSIAAMFLASVEREIVTNNLGLLDRPDVEKFICSRCSESGPRKSKLRKADKLAGGDRRRVETDSPPLPQPIHLNDDHERERTGEKRSEREEGGGESIA